MKKKKKNLKTNSNLDSNQLTPLMKQQHSVGELEALWVSKLKIPLVLHGETSRPSATLPMLQIKPLPSCLLSLLKITVFHKGAISAIHICQF